MKKTKKLSLKQKAKKAGVPAQIVYNRMHEGWSEKKALSVPVGKYTKKSTPVLSKEPKKVAYKVETKKVETVGSRVKSTPDTNKKPVVPLPVEKYEAPKSNTFIYLAVALVVVLIFAIMST